MLTEPRDLDDAPEDADLPAPIYTSWEDYLARTTERERLEWCRVKSKTTNRRRLVLDRAARVITALDVWQVAESAQGRCTYCGSLALEGRPSGHDGRPTPWTPVGRRIGSLEHRLQLADGGWNDAANLAWACLWCNTWENERRPGATDHGALQDCPSDEPPGEPLMTRQVAYSWKLRDVMTANGMYAATDLQPHLADRGIELSMVQVWRLVRGTPERLSLHFLAALCDIFQCTPADLISTEAAVSPPARPLTRRKWST